MLHKIQVQIRFNDIDIMGHVNNAVYQYYFDLARVDYFDHVLKEEDANLKKEALIVASIKVDYLKPVFMRDNIFVTTKITYIGNKSLKMTQEVINENNDIKATSETIMVAFSIENDSTIVIPEKWIMAINDFEKELKFRPLVN